MSLSSVISEMRQFCPNLNWSAAAILDSKYNDSCYIYYIMPYSFYGIEDMRPAGGTKNEDSIYSGFRDKTIF